MKKGISAFEDSPMPKSQKAQKYLSANYDNSSPDSSSIIRLSKCLEAENSPEVSQNESSRPATP